MCKQANGYAGTSCGRLPPGLEEQLLECYTTLDGERREVLTWTVPRGVTLVVDRPQRAPGSTLLLARLGCEEPLENARLVCEDFLRRVRVGPIRCRVVSPDDLLADAEHQETSDDAGAQLAVRVASVRGGGDAAFELADQRVQGALPQLRWWRCGEHLHGGGRERERPVSLREAIAHAEAYEPLCSATRHAIARAREFGRVSTTMLRAELARVQISPIVLNRGLREAVLETVQRGELSMSEIAIRCGRVKRDARGNESGETSWLGRRLGLLPEGGQHTPTPWVHSEVLALIARRGLGIAPREVEL